MSATKKMWGDRLGSLAPSAAIKFLKENAPIIILATVVTVAGFLMWVYGDLTSAHPISPTRLKVLTYSSTCSQEAVRAFISEKQRAITEHEVGQIMQSCSVKDAYSKQLNIL